MRPYCGKKAAIILVTLFTLLPAVALGNGAVWNRGTKSGVPGPIRQSDLTLKKEHVVFKEGTVTARFWVLNPTTKDIAVTMGFPFYEGFPGSFEVTVGNEKIRTERVKDIQETYPIVYKWEMSFIAGKVTEFTVQYPIAYSTFSSDFGDDGVSLNYVTHTGSFWAKPIGEATFEYCDKRIMDVVQEVPQGKEQYWSSNGRTIFTRGWKAGPKPFRVDKARGCIVWKRKNWRPKKTNDDIIVDFSSGKYSYDFECIDGECGGLKEIEEIFSDWCDLSEGSKQSHGFRLFRKAKDRKRVWLAEDLNLSEKKLSKSRIAEMELEAYQISHDAGITDEKLPKLPDHLKMEFQLVLYRYLRNYLFAIHGHKFKDERLAECFAGIKQVDTWSNTERANVDFLYGLEQKLKKKHKKAWQEVRSNKRDE